LSDPPQFLNDELLPLRYLNDLLFCERRLALHLVEQIWKDNQYTAEGVYAHKKVDQTANLKRGDNRNVTGMMLVSYRLGVTGKADLVEFWSADVPSAFFPTRSADVSSATPTEADAHRMMATPPKVNADGTSALRVPYPVDFKRGKKRRWDNDEVQLCAQAMCLEEMLNVDVPTGAIFHIKSQHRREVLFDESLRQQTITAAARLHEIVRTGITPPAEWKPRCKGCSLLETCMPKAWRPKATAAKYLESLRYDE
jgi:CRISPR-associated exonuclease Cas4